MPASVPHTDTMFHIFIGSSLEKETNLTLTIKSSSERSTDALLLKPKADNQQKNCFLL